RQARPASPTRRSSDLGARRAPKTTATPADVAPAWRSQGGSAAHAAASASPPHAAATGPTNANGGFAGAAPAWQQTQPVAASPARSEEHTSELQSRENL